MKFVAHRGRPKLELENTLESFIVAGCSKCFAIETDFTLLKDGNVIIYHDDDLKRLAGRDDLIRNLTLEEIKEVKLNARESYHTYDYKIADPVEYLRICKHYDKIPVIDIKWGYTVEAIDQLVILLDKEEMLTKAIIICYTMDIVLYIKEKYPSVNVQFLVGMLFSEKYMEICLDKKIDLDIRHDLVTKELVDRFHSKGLIVNCWTVDKEEDLERVTLCGVDMVTSNVFE